MTLRIWDWNKYSLELDILSKIVIFMRTTKMIIKCNANYHDMNVLFFFMRESQNRHTEESINGSLK